MIDRPEKNQYENDVFTTHKSKLACCHRATEEKNREIQINGKNRFLQNSTEVEFKKSTNQCRKYEKKKYIYKIYIYIRPTNVFEAGKFNKQTDVIKLSHSTKYLLPVILIYFTLTDLLC